MHLSENVRAQRNQNCMVISKYSFIGDNTYNSCGLYFPPADSASANLQTHKTRKIHCQLCLLCTVASKHTEFPFFSLD